MLTRYCKNARGSSAGNQMSPVVRGVLHPPAESASAAAWSALRNCTVSSVPAGTVACQRTRPTFLTTAGAPRSSGTEVNVPRSACRLPYTSISATLGWVMALISTMTKRKWRVHSGGKRTSLRMKSTMSRRMATSVQRIWSSLT